MVSSSLEKARTMVFLVACFYELVVVWSCRSEKHNAFKVGFLSNKALLIAASISVFSTLMVIYIPALSFAFQTVMPGPFDWLIVALLSLTGFLVLPEVFIKKKRE